MTISELKQQYENSAIDKKEYAARAFEKYEELIDFSTHIRETDIKEILIRNNGVDFRINRLLYDGSQCDILMRLYKKDAAAVPATILSFGSYETVEMNTVDRIIKMLPKGFVCFDIGANLGWYSLNIKKIRDDARVYAFEPIEETYKKMILNFEINDTSIVAFNFGLYNDNTIETFFYDTVASGASSMRDLRLLDTTKTIQCPMKKLDDVVKENNIDRLDFVKCDVEGSELFVYQGGSDSISKYKPVVFSEMLRKWAGKFGYHPNDIIQWFSNLGYQCFIIQDDHLKRFYEVDENTVETNYFFLHPKRHEEIIKQYVI